MAANWPVSAITSRTWLAWWTTSSPKTEALPGVGLEQRREHPHHRGLAGSVWPKQALTVPSSTVRSTPPRATVSPKRLTMPSASTARIRHVGS